jgi:hypothetical protein
MKQQPSSRRKRNSTESVLRLPDLELAKAAVLNSLNSADAKRGYLDFSMKRCRESWSETTSGSPEAVTGST